MVERNVAVVLRPACVSGSVVKPYARGLLVKFENGERLRTALSR